MKVTQVKVFRVEEEKVKAYVTIVLDECFVIRDVKIIQGATSLFIAMPSKRRKDGSFQDVAHPLCQDVRNELERAVLMAYVHDCETTGTLPGAAASEPRAAEFELAARLG